MEQLTQKRLKYLFDYDSEAGVFTRVAKPCNRVKIGDSCGDNDGHGYLRCLVDGKRYKLHRLAWLYVYGVWPTNEIDHINGIRDDNRILNLREATRAENSQNQSHPQKNNKCGVLGVWVDKNTNKFCAQIRVNGKKKWIGSFLTQAEASQAYLLAKNQYHEFYAGSV